MAEGSKSTENLDETPGVMAQRLHGTESQSRQPLVSHKHYNDPPDTERENHDLGDRAPVLRDASMEEKLLYSQKVNDYARHMLMHFRSPDDRKGEELWIEFTCTFCKESIIATTNS